MPRSRDLLSGALVLAAGWLRLTRFGPFGNGSRNVEETPETDAERDDEGS